MAKLTCATITSGYAAIAALNSNFDLIEAALENTLSRDGTSPNSMSANIDMNSNKVINLADGANAADAVNLRQLQAASVATTIPSQTGHAGKVLKTDGTVISWVSIAAQLGSDLTAAADKLAYFNGASTMTLADLSAFARTLLDDANAAAARSTLGVALAAKGSILAGSGSNNVTEVTVGNDGKVLVADSTQTGGVGWGFHNHGQCRLTKSGANLLLSPFNGNKLIINSKVETIPDAGVSLAPPAVASTTYYIYAYMNAGTMTLEQSATAPATQTGTGVQIKNGDATRTLVGMARTTSGNAWADTAAQRFVLSYFNRRLVAAANSFAANRTTASATYVELSSTERAEFLTWADEVVVIAASGNVVASAGGNPYTSIGIDDATAEDTCNKGPSASNSPVGLTLMTSLSEGYHYATILGLDNSSATSTWLGSAVAGQRCVINVSVRG